MTTFTKLATVTLAALMISTSLATAFDPIGVNETIAPTPSDSIQDAVQSGSAEQSIQTAVQFDPIRDINDAVLNGAKTGKGGKVVLRNGREILVAFSCEAGGNDLLTLRNKGDYVPAGTKVRWEVKSLGERGSVRLKTALGNGEKVRVDIGMDVDAGTPCAAKAI
jgi:hypothetical protein